MTKPNLVLLRDGGVWRCIDHTEVLPEWALKDLRFFFDLSGAWLPVKGERNTPTSQAIENSPGPHEPGLYEVVCKTCGGQGRVYWQQDITEYATRDMALDAGDPSLEGYELHGGVQDCEDDCPDCKGGTTSGAVPTLRRTDKG